MKHLLFISFSLLSSALSLACDNSALVVRRSSGFSIGSTGAQSGQVAQTVNIPVYADGQWGCWEQQSGIAFDVKENKNLVTIIPPKAKFKNLRGRLMSYALVAREGSALQLDVASFVCVGDEVLSAESFSGTVAQARMLESLRMEVRTSFATGVAARNLAEAERQRRAQLRAVYVGLGYEVKDIETELPGGLEAYFQQRYQGDWKSFEERSTRVPSVFLSSDVRSNLSSLSGSYTTVLLTRGACSREFEAVMAPLRFERLRLPEGIRSKLKKGNLELRW